MFSPDRPRGDFRSGSGDRCPDLAAAAAEAAFDAGAALAKIGGTGETSAQLCAKAQRLAVSTIPILIEGETGTGKSHLARAIHRASNQSDEPFHLIECAQLTEEGLRDDLAGEDSGNGGGVLCLDSPGAATLPVQKLLLALVERSTQRGTRIIAVSRRPLYDEMKSGAFRSDLYYRIAGARLQIPPLRDRKEEIDPLLRLLVQRHAARDGGRELRFTSGAMNVLNDYAWPGNLREMQNLIATLDALSPTGLIYERTLPPEYHQRERCRGAETLRDVERTEILDAIKAEDGNLSRAARRLGIARSTLYLKLDSHGISRPQKD